MSAAALVVDGNDVRTISSSVLKLVRNATVERDASWDDYVDQASHDHWGDDR
ncbi:MAG: hypothetical protein WCX99_00895 [Candidatus Paceibacterota bacterium]